MVNICVCKKEEQESTKLYNNHKPNKRYAHTHTPIHILRRSFSSFNLKYFVYVFACVCNGCWQLDLMP